MHGKMARFKVPCTCMKLNTQYCFTWHMIGHHVPRDVTMFCSLNKIVRLQNFIGELLCHGNPILPIGKLSSHAQVGN